jgi:hypothetical protein
MRIRICHSAQPSRPPLPLHTMSRSVDSLPDPDLVRSEPFCQTRIRTSGTGFGSGSWLLLGENLFSSGSGSSHFGKSDLDLVKNRPDSQHWSHIRWGSSPHDTALFACPARTIALLFLKASALPIVSLKYHILFTIINNLLL